MSNQKSTCLTCPTWGHEHLLAVFNCKDCAGPALCYSCAEPHQDAGHRVLGGVRDLDKIPEAQTELNQLFNQGAECTLNLDQLDCPCGKKVVDASEGAICCVCGTATCSDACHKEYVQDLGLCVYTQNYVEPIESTRQGCRCIRMADRTGEPGQYLSHVCGPRFVEAEALTEKTLLLRRGYSQFGQPLASTQKAMEIVQADPLKSKNTQRICPCVCNQCQVMAAHPIHQGHV